MVPYGMVDLPLNDILPPGTPTLGDLRAPVIIIEFSDFTCGYCGKFYRETLPQLKTQYITPGKLRFAYRDYPRDPEGWGLVAAHAARCAGEQARYWEMHDRLFDNGSRLGTKMVMQIAQDLKLNVNAFAACMDAQKHISAILADRDVGNRLGFRGTPGFLVGRSNGKYLAHSFTVPGALPYATFSSEIERLLKKR
jgi:protein-disulfide isomerase